MGGGGVTVCGLVERVEPAYVGLVAEEVGDAHHRRDVVALQVPIERRRRRGEQCSLAEPQAQKCPPPHCWIGSPLTRILGAKSSPAKNKVYLP